MLDKFVSPILYVVLQFEQDIKNGKLKLEHVQIVEENSGLHVQNMKLSQEVLYAKELASAAAVELKNLAGENHKALVIECKTRERVVGVIPHFNPGQTRV